MQILFFSDVDGTLAEGDVIAPGVEEAIRDFITQGNGFSLATGRHALAIRHLTKRLGLMLPCIVLAGAALYDPQTEQLTSLKKMPENTLPVLKEMLRRYPEMGIQVYTEKGLYNLQLNAFLRKNGIPQEIACGESESAALRGQQILKIGLCCEDTSQLEEAVGTWFSDERDYHWHYSYRIALEILSAGVNKGVALHELLRRLPEQPKLLAAAGDSPSDLPMLKIAACTFAPHNAFESVRMQVTHEIPTAAEGGIAEALSIVSKITEMKGRR